MGLQKKVIQLVLVMAAVILLYPVGVHAKEADTATVSIELFTIGCGYLAEPVQVPVTSGENAAETVLKVLHDSGYTAYYSGKPDNNFYLAYVGSGANTKNFSGFQNANAITGVPKQPETVRLKPDIPKYLLPKLKETMRYFDQNDYENFDGYIGELMFTNGAGWLFCLNNQFSGGTLSNITLSGGDVLRVQYTLAYGADIGGCQTAGQEVTETFYPVAGKDALLHLLAQVNQKREVLQAPTVLQAYNNANKAVQTLNSTQAEVNRAFTDLSSALAEQPAASDFTIPQTAANGALAENARETGMKGTQANGTGQESDGVSGGPSQSNSTGFGQNVPTGQKANTDVYIGLLAGSFGIICILQRKRKSS